MRPGTIGGRPFFRPEAEDFRSRRHLGATIETPGIVLRLAPLLPPAVLAMALGVAVNLSYVPQASGIYMVGGSVILSASSVPEGAGAGTHWRLRTAAGGGWQDYEVTRLQPRECPLNGGLEGGPCIAAEGSALEVLESAAGDAGVPVRVRLSERPFLPFGAPGRAAEGGG